MKKKILIIAAAVLLLAAVAGSIVYLYLSRCPEPAAKTASEVGQTQAFPSNSGCCTG